MRRVLAGAGLAVALLGVLFASVPGVAPGVAGVPSQAVLVLGGVAGLLAVWSVQYRRSNPPTQVRMPDPEVRSAFPRPGDDVNHLLDTAFDSEGVRAARDRERLKRRVRAVALGALVRRRNLTREEAERRLDEGEWTDDPYAARYFAEGSVDAPLPLRDRVKVALELDTAERPGARRAIAEVESIVGGGPAPTGAATAPETDGEPNGAAAGADPESEAEAEAGAGDTPGAQEGSA
jgi:hypothetical protein